MSITSPFLTRNAPFPCAPPAAPSGTSPAPVISSPAKAPPPIPATHAPTPTPTPTFTNSRRVVFLIALPLLRALCALRVLCVNSFFSLLSETSVNSAPLRYLLSSLLFLLCALCALRALCVNSFLYVVTSLRHYVNFSRLIFDSHSSFDFHCSSHVTSLPVYAAVLAIMHDTA